VTLRFLADGAVVAVPYAVPAERDRLYQRVAAADRDRVVMEPVDVADLAAMTAFAAASPPAAARSMSSWPAWAASPGLAPRDRRETWKRMLDLNLTTAFSAAKAVVPPHGRGALRPHHHRRVARGPCPRRRLHRLQPSRRRASSRSRRRWPRRRASTGDGETRCCRAPWTRRRIGAIRTPIVRAGSPWSRSPTRRDPRARGVRVHHRTLLAIDEAR